MILTLPKKLPDWEQRLHDFIESRKTTPFEWGVNDCCLFASDALLAMTGVDIADKFRGKYDSEKSCIELIESFGYSDIGDLIRKELTAWQLTPVEPVFAHRGDLVMSMQAGQPALCIVGLEGKHSLGVGHNGLMKIRTYHDAVQAWRIPYVA